MDLPADCKSAVHSTSRFDPDHSNMLDTISVWCSKNKEEMDKYAGKRVAIHAELGIIASGDTLREVIDKVTQIKGLEGFYRLQYIYPKDVIPMGFQSFKMKE